jgi:putative transposase
MARAPRALLAGHCYHAINRGNARSTVFHGPRDYRAFLKVICQACERLPMQILAACVMPNHFHFVLRPQSNDDMSRWFHWLLTTHVARHRSFHGTTGRIWQGRFKVFPIQQDGHLLSVMRYVERNALRAGLVRAAEDWPWGSLAWRVRGSASIPLANSPVDLPPDWARRVNVPQSSAEIAALRTCVNRQRPYGDPLWSHATAGALGLKSSFRNAGQRSR